MSLLRKTLASAGVEYDINEYVEDKEKMYSGGSGLPTLSSIDMADIEGGAEFFQALAGALERYASTDDYVWDDNSPFSGQAKRSAKRISRSAKSKGSKRAGDEDNISGGAVNINDFVLDSDKRLHPTKGSADPDFFEGGAQSDSEEEEEEEEEENDIEDWKYFDLNDHTSDEDENVEIEDWKYFDLPGEDETYDLEENDDPISSESEEEIPLDVFFGDMSKGSVPRIYVIQENDDFRHSHHLPENRVSHFHGYHRSQAPSRHIHRKSDDIRNLREHPRNNFKAANSGRRGEKEFGHMDHFEKQDFSHRNHRSDGIGRRSRLDAEVSRANEAHHRRPSHHRPEHHDGWGRDDHRGMPREGREGIHTRRAVYLGRYEPVRGAGGEDIDEDIFDNCEIFDDEITHDVETKELDQIFTSANLYDSD